MTTLPAWVARWLPERWHARAARLRPWLSPSAFVLGFLMDMFTLRRVDDVSSNVRLTLFLVLSGILLVLERRAWHGRWTLGFVHRHPALVRYGVQFCFGGLFNAYLIFYSRSATLGPSALLCAFYAALMLANEVWFERFRPDVPAVASWFFCALSYLLFAVPTWTGHLDDGARIAAAGLAVLAATAVVVGMHAGPVIDAKTVDGDRPAPSVPMGQALVRHAGAWAAMLVALVGLVAVGAVPPVPLALSEAGIFHSVEVSGTGYLATYDPPPWWAPWREDDRVFQLHAGESVACFTAVFAPTGLTLGVTHVWEHRAEAGWEEVQRLPFRMSGGRDGGWRSWTEKKHVAPGAWRVRVVSDQGWELGRVNFRVVEAEGAAPERRVRRL